MDRYAWCRCVWVGVHGVGMHGVGVCIGRCVCIRIFIDMISSFILHAGIFCLVLILRDATMTVEHHCMWQPQKV